MTARTEHGAPAHRPTLAPPGVPAPNTLEKTTLPRRLLARLKKPDTWWLLLALAVVGTLYWFFGCPIRRITGIPCPGCGMTRALFEAARLDFGAALYYHPMFPLVPVLAFLLAGRAGRRRPRLRNGAIIAVGLVFMAAYVVRLVTGTIP